MYEPKMMLVIMSLCLLALASSVQAKSSNKVQKGVGQCIDNDPLTTETFAAIENATKVSRPYFTMRNSIILRSGWIRGYLPCFSTLWTSVRIRPQTRALHVDKENIGTGITS